jgi:signal transduction histidine kinase
MNDIRMSDIGNKDDIVRRFLNATLKKLMSVVSAECGSLFIFDSQHKELVLDSFYNSVNLNLTGLRQRVGEGVCGKIADIRTPILVKDIDKDLRFKRNGFNHYKTNSFISIPLFTSSGFLGLINLTDKTSGDSFCEKDLEFAATIATCACLVIDSFNQSRVLRQEMEQLDKQKLLLEKYASMGKLAAGVVHEVNNPLDGVIRYTNILLDLAESNSVLHEYLLEIKKGLNRITNTTKSLLKFSHQVNSNYSQMKQYASIPMLLDDSLDTFSEKINGNVSVEKKYDVSLPRILDFGLSHVFVNIIKNSLDAMPHGGKLEISANMIDSMFEITFRDTGQGMPDEIKERIFEPFFTTKSIDKGTGLGLAICNEIINKYGGKIEVQSAFGIGSTFNILIPQKYLENAQPKL